MKQAAHVIDFRSIPPSNILVEGGGGTKHIIHVLDLRSIPPSNILVEGGGVTKHIIHGLDLRSIPTRDIIIEALESIEIIVIVRGKQIRHVGNSRSVPVRNVSIFSERSGAIRNPKIGSSMNVTLRNWSRSLGRRCGDGDGQHSRPNMLDKEEDETGSSHGDIGWIDVKATNSA